MPGWRSPHAGDEAGRLGGTGTGVASLLAPVFESSTGAANQANISKGALLNILVPLPPLAEQAAIVERLEVLMQHCRALATEIEHARTHANHLLQAVLKEAFAQAS